MILYLLLSFCSSKYLLSECKTFIFVNSTSWPCQRKSSQSSCQSIKLKPYFPDLTVLIVKVSFTGFIAVCNCYYLLQSPVYHSVEVFFVVDFSILFSNIVTIAKIVKLCKSYRLLALCSTFDLIKPKVIQ